MPRVISRLIDFSFLPKNRPYMEQALSTYFEPIYEVTETEDQAGLVRVLGQQVFQQLHTCAMEFFFSNDYDEEDGGYWNLIDRFLSTKPLGLTEEDRQYLKGSRRSLLSIYEVQNVVPDISLTLRDLVRGGKPVVVREKSATRFLAKWDKIALRVVDMGDYYVMGGGGLPLDKEAAEYALDCIRYHQEMTASALPMLMGENMDKDYLEHIRQSLWAVEIGEAYVTALLERREQLASAPPPVMCNTEGHKIVDCVLTFPLHGEKAEISKRIAAMQDVEEDGVRKGRPVWAWISTPEPMKPVAGRGRPRKTGTIGKAPKPQDNVRFTLRGRLILEKECLRAEANSRERAAMLEAMVQKHLKGLVGKAKWEITTQEAIRRSETGAKKPKTAHVAPKSAKDAALLAAVIDDHYRQWVDMNIPALNGKTPRQAARSKAGRQKLVELLKTMENGEHRRARGSGQTPYDFSWMWQELGIADAIEAA